MPDGKPDSVRVDPGSPVLWHQIVAAIRARIESGELQPGKPAPSITSLVQSGYAKSRPTCAKALRALADEGLLIRHPGLGYYVAGDGNQPG